MCGTLSAYRESSISRPRFPFSRTARSSAIQRLRRRIACRIRSSRRGLFTARDEPRARGSRHNYRNAREPPGGGRSPISTADLAADSRVAAVRAECETRIARGAGADRRQAGLVPPSTLCAPTCSGRILSADRRRERRGETEPVWPRHLAAARERSHSRDPCRIRLPLSCPRRCGDGRVRPRADLRAMTRR